MLDPGDKRVNRPTVKDVARVARVGVGTVSRVINNHSSVSEERRARVLEAMRRLGFRPSAAAQTMRSQATRAIGCMITDITHPLVTSMVSAAEQHLRAHGYATIIGSSGEEPEQELQLLDFFASRQVDGLIAHVSQESFEPVVRAIRNLHVPVVLFERKLVPAFDGVYMDHAGASYEATRYLVGLGHRRIALVTGAAESYPGSERRRMLSEALQEIGVAFDEQYFRGIRSSVSEGLKATESLLALKEPPTAIIFGGYEMVGVLKAVSKSKLRVPQDISLVALGDTEWTDLARPAITAVSWDTRHSGIIVAELLLDRLIRQPRVKPRQVVLPAKFIVRASTAPPGKLEARLRSL